MINQLINDTDTDNIIWKEIAKYPEIDGSLYKTMIKIDGNKFISCLMYINRKNIYDLDMNKLCIFLVNKSKNEKISSFYFKTNKDLYLLSYLIRFKCGENINPYEKIKINLNRYIDTVIKNMENIDMIIDNKKNILKYLELKRVKIILTNGITDLEKLKKEIYNYTITKKLILL
jgi:hypothetical protein